MNPSRRNQKRTAALGQKRNTVKTTKNPVTRKRKLNQLIIMKMVM